MKFTKEEVKNAYTKLKSYIYYDNTDLLLRRQLVEFETNIGKNYLIKNPSAHYNIGGDRLSYKINFNIEEKFERIAQELNLFHKKPEFFNSLLSDINVNFYPKKIKPAEEKINFITNKRVRNKYEVERVTPFINAPIELHIISVLWIMRHGVHLDANLSDECFGNRLLLNKEKTDIIQGSALFKPYFNQYRKWRDNAVEVAKNLIKKNKNVAFINLDIKDYFSSVRINRTELFNGRKHGILNESYNLSEIFLNIHDVYTKLLSLKFQSPTDFYSDLIGEDGNLQKIVLPIGLVSSYVLANAYLREFDKSITNYIKPAYYGRYVDDMLFVIYEPEPGININDTNEYLKFDLSSYEELNPSKIEKFILERFHPVIDLKSVTLSDGKKENVFQLSAYDSLICQSEKSLVHYFDSKESHIVIDKLKQELDERTSEFRDFPEEDTNNLSFKSCAYHLHYDGTEGKIRTLKDYKENRFGLTVFLSNRIFSALRHENHLSDDECDQIVNFFKGETCLTFYRLWERILTLLLVNQKPKHYIEFFLHCFAEIEKIEHNSEISKIQGFDLKDTLVNYLDVSHEISQSLNLDFLNKTKKVARNFDFQLNHLKNSNWSFLFNRFEPTRPDSPWVRRFRTSNMLRHHYVIHPLLSYTEASKKGALKDLTNISIELKTFNLDKKLIEESPRSVKFWECCMAIAFKSISSYSNKKENEIDSKIATGIFGVKLNKKSQNHEFYLDDAFDLYKWINQNHIPFYKFEDERFRDNFYKIYNNTIKNIPIINAQEIIVGTKKKNRNIFKIAFANTKVDESNIIASLRGTPNLNSSRYDKLANIVKKVRLDKSDILLFPEFFLPINLLSSLVKYSEKNQVLIITGIEHVKIKNTVFNFIVTILPFEIDGVSDAVVIFRLKNHYAHIEESLIRGNHLKVATPKEYRYDIFNWENLYFCPYYCFELANVWHRSIFRSKLDLLIGVEWNKDTNYFSNIVESCSRDLHCYIAQVNTSQFGDSRLTQPAESARLDILRLQGGSNDAILVAEIDLAKIREFQRKTFDITHSLKEFKPLPPDFNVDDVIKRINNESIIK